MMGTSLGDLHVGDTYLMLSSQNPVTTQEIYLLPGRVAASGESPSCNQLRP